MTSPSVIGVDSLSVVLGGRPVLHSVDLEIHPGDLVGLIGPNGAGKTTLLRSVLGLIRPTQGRVLVDGRPARAGRARIGYVPQRHEFAWDFPISVEDAVMSGRTGAIGLGRRPGTGDWRAVDTALARVDMTGLRTRPVAELSGGQRQRVLVARALSLGSAALLLDEPFTGLDIPTQDVLSELVASLAAEGTAVLMATHDLTAAISTCDRLVLLNRTIVASGSGPELADDPSVWIRAFGVAEGSPLITTITASARHVTR